MKANLQITILLLLLFGCKEQETQLLLSDSYERWQSHNIHNYAIDQVRICFCPDAGQTMRITVRSDTVVSVMRLSDSTIMQYPISAHYLTVDSLFSIIRNNGTDSLVVLYHATYGYPEKLDVNPQQHAADGGVLYETSNLQIR